MMAVDDFHVVDGMGTDRATGEVVLTISDHLDWEDERSHLEALQAKMNCYLDFVQSGQVYEKAYAPVGTPVRFDVICKFPVPDSVRWFFDAADKAADQNGVALTYRQLPSGY